MSRCKLVVGLCTVLFLGVSMLSAQTAGAMLYANGSARVNGQVAAPSSSVFAGDRIDVSAASSASINRGGSSVVVSPNSSIQYATDSIQVIQGGARVSTSKGMSASAGEVLVSPKDSVARFDVVRAEDKVVIVSREGALTVNDGGRILTVPAGSSTELPLQGAAGTSGQPAAFRTSSVNFISESRLTEHPFYGVLNGVSSKPDRLPICEDVLLCIRPGVSKIHPCCCPPVLLCQ